MACRFFYGCSTSLKNAWEFFIPRPFFPFDLFLDAVNVFLVRRLYLAISLWPGYGAETKLDVEFVAVFYRVFTNELPSIISD